MAAEQLPKRQKLRNAEYYDFQGVQDELYRRSTKNHVFGHLMDSILTEENIMMAYRNFKRNAGSKTAGVDGKTIKHLAAWPDERLIEHVRKRLAWYTPQAVRRVEIPKPSLRRPKLKRRQRATVFFNLRARRSRNSLMSLSRIQHLCAGSRKRILCTFPSWKIT